MQNSHSVITQAVDGIGVKLAEEMEISTSRLYQLLEADYYGKTKRLIRTIAKIDKTRVGIIKADLDALFAAILGHDTEPHIAEVNAELCDVIQSHLEHRSNCEQIREVREAMAILNLHLAALERKAVVSAKVTERFAGVN